MYADQPAATAFAGQGGRASSIETGTKLYISNLDYGVSNDDIKVRSLLSWYLATCVFHISPIWFVLGLLVLFNLPRKLISMEDSRSPRLQK